MIGFSHPMEPDFKHLTPATSEPVQQRKIPGHCKCVYFLLCPGKSSSRLWRVWSWRWLFFPVGCFSWVFHVRHLGFHCSLHDIPVSGLITTSYKPDRSGLKDSREELGMTFLGLAEGSLSSKNCLLTGRLWYSDLSWLFQFLQTFCCAFHQSDWLRQVSLRVFHDSFESFCCAIHWSVWVYCLWDCFTNSVKLFALLFTGRIDCTTAFERKAGIGRKQTFSSLTRTQLEDQVESTAPMFLDNSQELTGKVCGTICKIKTQVCSSECEIPGMFK